MTSLATPGAMVTTPASRRNVVVAALGRREVQILLAILLVCGVSGALHPDFLTAGNISFMLADAVGTVLLSIGQTIVILGKGIDLSVAPILGIGAVVVGLQAQDHGLPVAAGLGIVVGLGLALGIGNGLLVSVAGLPPIIATLATLTVYGGLQFIVSHGLQVDTLPNAYSAVGNGNVLPGVPWLIVVAAGFVGIFSLVLNKTVFGRSVYAVGNNADAAFRAGIPVRRVLFFTYVLSGLLAGIAGLVYLCHTGTADSTTGSDSNVELTSIAASLIGGTSLLGGRGGPLGSALGAVFLSVALTAMVFARIPPIWEPAGVGVLILLAIVFDRKHAPAARRRPLGVRRAGGGAT